MELESLATYRKLEERVQATWPLFQQRRQQCLAERERFGHAAERATENILDALLTDVLDWAASDVNHQVGFADLLLTSIGIKYLVVEAKHPGALTGHPQAVDEALRQAWRYADEQRVQSVAVSDGDLVFVADVEHGWPLRGRACLFLSASDPPSEELWWLSVHGIYRRRDDDAPLIIAPPDRVNASAAAETEPETGERLLHPKYKLPADCFAYVGRANDPHTWHLPYRRGDGSVDLNRLPKAIQAVLSNYRGERVTSIPEPEIPAVLVRLARAAKGLGKLGTRSAPVYQQLTTALDQLGRLPDVEQ